jgi:cyclopropane fatty-acyl-phospholipid synthase-like methyltransferase
VVQAGYDRIADRYAAWASGLSDPTAAEQLALLAERLPDGAHLLDLGCGDGGRLVRYAGRLRITAVDISFEQVRRARLRLPGARVLQADMTRLEFAPESFDGVSSLYAFNHLPFGQLPRLLHRVADWLRPGGLLVANMGARRNPGSIEADWLGAPMYFSGYDMATNRTFLEAAGLVIESAQEATLWETREGQAQPARFFWVVARRLPPDQQDPRR